MTTKQQRKSAEKYFNRARAVLTGRNFIKSKRLGQLLELTAQRSSDILFAMPEWRKYTRGYRGQTWAREGYPLGEGESVRGGEVSEPKKRYPKKVMRY